LTDESSDVVDPSVDSNTEDKENMPESNDNISTESCQASTTCTEPEDNGAEVPIAQTARKGDLLFML
jgi:condensin complex subunit 1